MVDWNGRWWLGVNVDVWNWRWWLFGIDVGGCLELTLVVVWNCSCWLLELSLLVMNGRWWFFGIVVDGCLEWTLVVRS